MSHDATRVSRHRAVERVFACALESGMMQRRIFWSVRLSVHAFKLAAAAGLSGAGIYLADRRCDVARTTASHQPDAQSYFRSV